MPIQGRMSQRKPGYEWEAIRNEQGISPIPNIAAVAPAPAIMTQIPAAQTQVAALRTPKAFFFAPKPKKTETQIGWDGPVRYTGGEDERRRQDEDAFLNDFTKLNERYGERGARTVKTYGRDPRLFVLHTAIVAGIRGRINDAEAYSKGALSHTASSVIEYEKRSDRGNHLTKDHFNELLDTSSKGKLAVERSTGGFKLTTYRGNSFFIKNLSADHPEIFTSQ
jgi:hypothetical protein